MSDREARTLERQAAADPDALARLIARTVPVERIRLAAALGHPVALRIERPANVSENPWDWPAATLDDATWRLWGCDCAERPLLRERAAGREPDPRSWEVVAASRRYAAAKASREELDAARDTAWAAAWDAAAGAAARGAAWAAARGADRAAARSAGWAAGWDAAGGEERAWQRDAMAQRLLGLDVDCG